MYSIPTTAALTRTEYILGMLFSAAIFHLDNLQAVFDAMREAAIFLLNKEQDFDDNDSRAESIPAFYLEI